jgi:hypothetical protein
MKRNIDVMLGDGVEVGTWFRQLDLAPFDGLIWPHLEGM